MLRLLLDENIDHDILRGLRKRLPEADIITVQEARLLQMPDPDLLVWAVNEHRIIVTHDLKTMPKYAYERVMAGHFMSGVFTVPKHMPIGEAIEQLLLLIACSDASEWENRVLHLPF